MKKLHLIPFAVIAILCMTAMQSCFNDETEQTPSTVNLNRVSVDNSEIEVTAITQQKKFTITSNVDWTITAPGLTGTDGGWYTLSAVSGKGTTEIIVDVKSNTTGLQRTAVLTAKGKYNEVTVTVKQLTDINSSFDPTFLAWCLDSAEGNIDTDGDGSISKAEAEATTKIECNTQSLTSLKGISNFTKLSDLRCYDNQLTELDLSANTELDWLSCYDNKLTTLNLSANTKLTSLSCGDNQLTELNLSVNRELGTLFCRNNPSLATIDIRGSSFDKLKSLHCTTIKSGAKVIVWSGFNITDKPATSTWNYDIDVVWEPVS